MGGKPALRGKISYNPTGKKEREVRRQTYYRYYQMRDNDWRSEAEREWEMADKEYQLWMSDEALSSMTTQGNSSNNFNYSYPTQNIPDPDDTRSHLKLPDAVCCHSVAHARNDWPQIPPNDDCYQLV